MHMFMAGLATETNSFSPIPTGRRAFEDTMVSRTATQDPPNLFSAPLHVWRDMAEAEEWRITESLCAFAQPAGPTVQRTYETYRDEILADLAEAAPDIALFSMHGAMIADGYDDCEGDLLARAREICPSATIGLEIDPHSHITDAMLTSADLIICYKEYPHTDPAERARELFTLAAQTQRGEIQPVMTCRDCRMITMYHTSRAPMRGIVDDMQVEEAKDGVLSLSLSHGFPWGDVAEVSTRMIAITDNAPDLGAEITERFAARLWSERASLLPDWPSIRDALDHGARSGADKPVIIADFADNAGGGAPADSTFVLKEILAKDLKQVAIGLFWDPVLTAMALDAGVGSQMKVRLGGKIDVTSGDPVDLDVVVRGAGEGVHQMMGETQMAMGDAVWLEADGVHLVVCSKRTQAFHPMAFTQLGLDLSQVKIVVVKSSQHFYAGFAPIGSEVLYINGPGAITPDYANIGYTKRDDNFWPRVSNPFADI